MAYELHLVARRQMKNGISRGLIYALALGLMSIAFKADAQIAPNSPTTNWVAIRYGNSTPDTPVDQQTGSPESDLVGDNAHPSFYMKFADAPTPSPTNGWLGFRLRLGADANPPGFKSLAFVGLDANMDGALDLFVGVDNQGTSASISIWNPGAGANTSPNTTSIENPSIRNFAETSANYSFLPVSLTLDPTATNLDLDSGAKVDHFLTFILPFSDVVWAMGLQGISGFNKDTSMRMVAATATQRNSLNQDLNGVNGGINSSSTWEQLGGFALPYSASSVEPVPEPGPFGFFFLGLILLFSTRVSRLMQG